MEQKINVELSKILWILILPSLEEDETSDYLLPDLENRKSFSNLHG